MSRVEKAAEAARLRREGSSVREIALRMGVARSTASSWLIDPDGSRLAARKRSYGGTCRSCGARTTGSDGPAAAPEICADCWGARHEERNRRIFAAWNAGETAPVIAAREGVTPEAVTSLVGYCREAGEPLVLHRRRDRELWPLIERRWWDGATGAEIAAECGISRANLYMMVKAMRRAGVDLPVRYRGERAAA